MIDDDNSCRSMFKLYLDNLGECETASLGLDGINKVKEAFGLGQSFDLIVIDMILPDIKGSEVLEMLRTEEELAQIPESSRTKVILTTSLDDEINRGYAKRLKKGIEAYYVKSFATEGFSDKLDELGL